MWTDGQSVRDRTFGPRHPTGGRPDRDVRDGSTLSTQAVFRPDFGDEDNFPIRRSADTEPQDRMATTSRVRPPVRRLGGGLVEILRAPDIDPL